MEFSITAKVLESNKNHGQVSIRRDHPNSMSSKSKGIRNIGYSEGKGFLKFYLLFWTIPVALGIPSNIRKMIIYLLKNSLYYGSSTFMSFHLKHISP